MLKNHPHIRVILESIQRFRNNELGVSGFQDNLSAIMTALEGDIPKDVREAIEMAETRIDSIRFTVNSEQQDEEVNKVLVELEQIINRN